MRGAQDKDFGTQIVGRILRVDGRLQGRSMPDLFKYGYVFLADAEKQSGLVGAADRINALRTEMATVSPFTMVVRVGTAEPTVQVIGSGRQPSLIPTPCPPSLSPDTSNKTSHKADPAISAQSLLPGFILPDPVASGTSPTPVKINKATTPPGIQQYHIKEGMARVFKTERLNLNTAGLLRCVEKRLLIDD